MQAVICPVCKGTGKIEAIGLNDGIPIDCHGCKDKDGISRGWVQISDSDKIEKEYIPMPIYPSNPYKPEPIAPAYPWWEVVPADLPTYINTGTSAEWLYVGNTFVGKNSDDIDVIKLN